MITKPAIAMRSTFFMTWFRDRIIPKLLILFATLISLSVAADAIDSTTHLSVCKDFGCKSKQSVSLSDAHWQLIESHFRVEASSAAVERVAIAKAIATFEQLIGPLTNTEQEKGGNIDGIGLPGQMDCIDESTNTTTYLQAMEIRGLFRWHTTGDRAYRRPYIFDQHWSATITQKDSGERWAVDSWFLDNGKRPYVQAIDKWYAKDTLPPNPDTPTFRKVARIEIER